MRFWIGARDAFFLTTGGLLELRFDDNAANLASKTYISTTYATRGRVDYLKPKRCCATRLREIPTTPRSATRAG